MYTINTVKEQPAHYEGYQDDAIICFASAHTDFVKKTVDWVVPEGLKNDFETFIKSEPLDDTTDKIIWEEYEKWFIKKLCLKNQSIHIGISKRYFTSDIEYTVNDDNIYYNQQPRPKGTGYVVLIRYLYSGFNTFFKRPKGRGIKPLNTNKKNGKIENIKCNVYLAEFAYNNFYEKNHTAAYIANNQILAMVSVREDGKIINALPNIPYYDKIEYILLCLKRLVNEFKINNRKLY